MNEATNAAGKEPAWVRVVRDKIESLRFGVVQIVVHESRVVQIESTEKLRFDKPETPQPIKPERSWRMGD